VLWSIHCSIYSLSFEKKLTAAVVRLCALMSRLAANIIFVSRTSRSQHEALATALSQLCCTNGIDTICLRRCRSKEFGARRIGSAEECFANRRDWSLSPDEDHANFANAAEKIAAQHAEVHFLLAGRDVDSDNRTLMDLIRKTRTGWTNTFIRRANGHRTPGCGARHLLPFVFSW